MWNPLSWVMEAAAVMAIALANGGVNASLLLHATAFSLALILSVKQSFVFLQN